MGRKKIYDRKKLIGLPNDLFTAIDSWRLSQPDKPDQSEAIRRLIKLALEQK